MDSDDSNMDDDKGRSATVDEIIASVLNSKNTKLHGKLRGSTIMKFASKRKSFQREKEQKEYISLRPQSHMLKGSAVDLSRISSQHDSTPVSCSMSTSKMIRSVSTPEIGTKVRCFSMQKTNPSVSRRINLGQGLLFSSFATRDCSSNKENTCETNKLENRPISTSKGYTPRVRIPDHFWQKSKNSTSTSSIQERNTLVSTGTHQLTTMTSCLRTLMHDNVDLSNSNSQDQSHNEKSKNDRFSLPFNKKPLVKLTKPETSSIKENRETNLTFKREENDEKSSVRKTEMQTPSSSVIVQNSDILTIKGNTYWKLGTLGKGGTSIVYKVLDCLTKDVKAVKVVCLKNEEESVLNSYINEIKILERLQYSERIIKLYDYEVTDTDLKLVMEEGVKDLAAILSDTRKNKVAIQSYTIKHYWQEMLRAVQVIHKEGIIHSDLKPANFILVRENLKLIDFGIASSIQQDMTSVFKESQAGTFNYMSPESLRDVSTGPIINGDVPDKPRIKMGVKSDVWSLGCILYNLVYGRTPFQHITKPLPKLAAISNPETKICFENLADKDFLDVLKSCLRFQPEKRPSIEQLLRHPLLKEH